MRYTIGVVTLFGFGCSGAGDFGSAVCGSVVSGGQLDQQAAGTVIVAPDEKHVAFLRSPSTVEAGCINRGAQLTTGTLVVLELQSDGSVCERVVAGNVQAQSLFFSSDSRGLAFLNDVDTCGVGKLRTADVDGTNVRLVHESVSYEQGVGSTVVFNAKDEAHALAAPIAGGKTASLGTLPAWAEAAETSNATGRAFAYRSDGSDNGIAAGSLVLMTLPFGKPAGRPASSMSTFPADDDHHVRAVGGQEEEFAGRERGIQDGGSGGD